MKDVEIKFFVSIQSGYSVIDVDDLYFKTCSLSVFRTIEQQLNFISKTKNNSYLVMEVFARLYVTEINSVLNVSIDEVFPGGTIFPLRLESIKEHFKKYNKEIKLNFL